MQIQSLTRGTKSANVGDMTMVLHVRRRCIMIRKATASAQLPASHAVNAKANASQNSLFRECPTLVDAATIPVRTYKHPLLRLTRALGPQSSAPQHLERSWRDISKLLANPRAHPAQNPTLRSSGPTAALACRWGGPARFPVRLHGLFCGLRSPRILCRGAGESGEWGIWIPRYKMAG